MSNFDELPLLAAKGCLNFVNKLISEGENGPPLVGLEILAMERLKELQVFLDLTVKSEFSSIIIPERHMAMYVLVLETACVTMHKGTGMDAYLAELLNVLKKKM